MRSLIQGTAVYGLLRRYRYTGRALTPVAQRPLPSWPPARDPWADPLREVRRGR